MPTYCCGRLTVGHDRTSTDIQLADDGGRRRFQYDPLQSTFFDIHHLVRKMFSLPHGRRSYLYDFRRQRIYFNQYQTFHEYITRFGLLSNRTVIYLGTYQADHVPQSATSSGHRMPRQLPVQSHIENIPLNSNDESVDLCVSDSDDDDDVIILDDPDPVCETKYSPIEANKDLIERIELLLRENSSNDTLIQLRKQFCVIHGWIAFSINRLSAKLQLPNEDFVQSEVKFYSDTLATVFDKCQSAKELIDSNRYQTYHLQTFAAIVNSFNRLFTYIETLKNQWMERLEKRSTSMDLEHSNDCLQVLPKSPPRTTNDNKIEPNHAVFDEILKVLKSVSDPSSPLNLGFAMKISVGRVESLRRTTDLHNERSICQAKQVLLKIKGQFTTKLNELDHSQWLSDSDEQLEKFCHRTLVTLQSLFHTLDRHQMKIVSSG